MGNGPFDNFNFFDPNPGMTPGMSNDVSGKLVPSAMTAGSSPLGFNMDTLRLGLGGLQTIGNLWNSFQANKLASEQFDFTKGITKTNLSNSIQSYNTSLADRINSRAFTEGRPDGYAAGYIADNRMTADPAVLPQQTTPPRTPRQY